ncbi:MAG: hypothetical protein ABI265_01610 [Gallionella sp.]
MKLASNPIIRIVAIAMFLSGCATAPQHLTERNKSGIKNIAIVSLVPESVNFAKIGIFASSDIYTKFDAGSKVTDSILYVSRARIAKSYPGWTLKNVEYDRSALLTKLNTASGLNATRAKQAFADLARKNDLDAIFVVRAAADKKDSVQQDYQKNYLGEGINVLLKNNNIGGDAKLEFRANLSVAIIGKSGEIMALGSIPARLDHAKERDLDDFGVTLDMKHNAHPEIQDKLGRGVVIDLARRLNLCFDSLGFINGTDPELQHVKIIPPPDVVVGPQEKAPVQAGSTPNSFDLCFSRCRQYTDRTKEQCFDACNK